MALNLEFRDRVRTDRQLRMLDVLGHLLLATAIYHCWIGQFGPDVMIPFLFWRSWQMNKLLPELHPAVVTHKLLHTVWPAVALLAVGEWYWGMQWLSHVVWDLATHFDPVFRKNVFWVGRGGGGADE